MKALIYLFKALVLMSGLFLLVQMISCTDSKGSQTDSDPNQTEEKWEPNLVYKWAKVILEATANDTDLFKPRPTVSSRFLALITAAMYDAWSRYDDTHLPLNIKDVERRPEEERTTENKEIAISYAAYRAAKEYFYTDSLLFTEFMHSLGLDPEDDSMDPGTPSGIGNIAASRVIEDRRGDGSNQYGEETETGIPYFNYIGYRPVNTPDENIDINRWQPKYFLDEEGEKFAPDCLTPYWYKVKPFF
jgi:hypothetical protein